MAKKKKLETVNVTSKDIVILRFPSEWPVEEVDLQAMMKTIRTTINSDKTIVKRFVCLAKGLEIETFNEDKFIEIWKSKFGEQSFENAIAENSNQISIFPTVGSVEPKSIDEVLEVTLNAEDDDGNTWKGIDDEMYDQVERGEL
jgi:hypothetical protein